MLRIALFLLCLPALGLMCLPSRGDAACFVDYKAKRDAPLRLHYGVAQITGPCSAQDAAPQLAARLGAEGWQLLTIISTFGQDGLDERKDSAGQYFLRF